MDVLRPASLEEALALKAERPEAVPIAGGTDLLVELASGRPRPEAMIDLTRVPELREWRHDDGSFLLGAGVTYTQIVRGLREFVPLVQASRTVGSPQIRNRGTVGGNLGTASPAGDALPVLAVYEAEIVLASAVGSRTLPWSEFLVGPKRTALHDDELIVGARWPIRRRWGSFSKVGMRSAMVIAVASVALVLDEDLRKVRVALGSVGPTILRTTEAEEYAADRLDWDDLAKPLPSETAARFGALVAAAARPIDDVRGTAAYRREVCGVLAGRALRWLAAERSSAAQAA